MRFESLFLAGVVAWLAYASWEDWRASEVGHAFSLVPMVAFGLARVGIIAAHGTGVAWCTALGALLLLAAFFIKDAIAVLVVGGLAFLAAGLGGGSLDAVIVLYSAALLLWRLQIWGGGDAKVFVALASLFPDVRLGVAVMVTSFVFGIIVLFRRYRRAMVFALTGPLQSMRVGKVPANMAKEELEGLTLVAMVPWISAGTLLYLVWASAGGRI